MLDAWRRLDDAPRDSQRTEYQKASLTSIPFTGWSLPRIFTGFGR